MSTSGDEGYCLPYESDDDDSEDFGAMFASRSGQYPKEKHARVGFFTTLSMNGVMKKLQENVEKLREIFHFSLGISLLVLRHYDWNVDDTTLEKYTDDKENVNKKLKITEVVDTHDCTDGVLVWNEEPMECPVCEDIVPAGASVALMNCRHFLCVDCLTSNLLCAFNNGDDLIDKRCPIGQCWSVVGLTVFEKLLSPDVYGQIEQRILNEYISGNKYMCCCPNLVPCEGVIYLNSVRKSRLNVSCNFCGLEFCFNCFRSPHAPATCDMLRKWEAILSKNEPSLAVIEKTTKGCPSCLIRVEKNQGCNHMQCTQCQHEYCWVCLGPWSEHGADNYTCNKKATKEMKNEGDLLLDCYERWHNHQQSLLLETKLFEENSQYLRTLARTFGDGPIYDQTLKFLLNTKCVLRDCRIVLINGYIALYFNEPSRIALRYRIGQLEVRTEELSQLIDSPPRLFCLDNIQSSARQAAHWCSILKEKELD